MLAFAAFGVGIVGLAAGGVAGALTLGKRSAIQDNCDGALCTHDGKVAADAARATGLISTIGFGVGLVGAGAGALLLLLSPSGAASSSVGVTPLIGPGSAGASLGGAF